MQNILTPAAEQVLTEARTIADAATTNRLAANWLASCYSQAHFRAQSLSARYDGPVAVVRKADTYLGLRFSYSYAEHGAAIALGLEVVAVYEKGLRRAEQTDAEQEAREAFDALMEAYAQQLEDEEIAEAARDLAEEEEAAAMLRRALEWGVAPLRLVAIVPAPREAVSRRAYCELPGANIAAWKRENGLLWEALKLEGLTPERHLRLVGASAVLGFSVESFRVLKPRELRRVREAVEARRFYANWTLIEQSQAA